MLLAGSSSLGLRHAPWLLLLLAGACAVDSGASSDDATGTRELAIAGGAAPAGSDDPKACRSDSDCTMIPVGCSPGDACPAIGWITLNRPAAETYAAAHRCGRAAPSFCPISLLVWPFVPRCGEDTRQCELVMPSAAAPPR
jgi:hypothetical protein